MRVLSTYTSCGLHVSVHSLSTFVLIVSYIQGTWAAWGDVLSRKPEHYFGNHSGEQGSSLYFSELHIWEIIFKILTLIQPIQTVFVSVGEDARILEKSHC